VVITPYRSRVFFPRSARITPNPMVATPGSIPSMIMPPSLCYRLIVPHFPANGKVGNGPIDGRAKKGTARGACCIAWSGGGPSVLLSSLGRERRRRCGRRRNGRIPGPGADPGGIEPLGRFFHRSGRSAGPVRPGRAGGAAERSPYRPMKERISSIRSIPCW
jgi:hypothetical protein